MKMNTARKLPLEGIMVLELGHTAMGPPCGLVLADMGADVYKVERTGKGDDTRWLKGFGAGVVWGMKLLLSLNLGQLCSKTGAERGSHYLTNRS
jgi:crotonobetainyl-CoA:carnitine CoA-transferase CaiB-like acyl-CoA transferase